MYIQQSGSIRLGIIFLSVMDIVEERFQVRIYVRRVELIVMCKCKVFD